LFLPIHDIAVQPLAEPQFAGRGIAVSVLRADTVHPVASGNKLFKLHHFLGAAGQSVNKTLLTFGGAWSNHLVATAFACQAAGIRAIGVVRGERPAQLSHTLLQCGQLGMELQYVGRQQYAHKTDGAFLRGLAAQWGPHVLVPEGGYHPLGAKGAALMLPADMGPYTHIACALGTATTVAGLLLAAPAHVTVLGFCALRGMTDIDDRLRYLLDGERPAARFLALPQYCFAGYAKKDPLLFGFMNGLWQRQGLPTDFVYTAKMLYGVYDLAAQGFFPKGSHVLCVHTGGLQGNASLPNGTLTQGKRI
jgi:1-aminocyclopropane-1-carboxylate deaminase